MWDGLIQKEACQPDKNRTMPGVRVVYSSVPSWGHRYRVRCTLYSDSESDILCSEVPHSKSCAVLSFIS